MHTGSKDGIRTRNHGEPTTIIDQNLTAPKDPENHGINRATDGTSLATGAATIGAATIGGIAIGEIANGK